MYRNIKISFTIHPYRKHKKNKLNPKLSKYWSGINDVSKRLKILEKINNLEDNHCSVCEIRDTYNMVNSQSYCLEKCNIGTELQELGNKYEEIGEKRIDYILSKGKNMTSSEILYLLNRRVTRKTIANAMEVSLYALNDMLKKVRKCDE